MIHRLLVAVVLTACVAMTQAAERPDRRKAPAPVIDLASSTSPEQILELMNQVEQLQGELRQLQNRVELQEHELDKLRSRQRDLVQDLDQRLQQVEKRNVSDQAAPKLMVPPGTGPEAGPEAEQREYDAAFALLKQGQYEKATRSFDAFLANHPQGVLADNAQYWLAESNYVQHNLKRALEEFNELIQKYPTSPKVPDALLKVGYVQHEQGEPGKARKTLEDLVRRFPNSSAAKLAEKRLEKLATENQALEKNDEQPAKQATEKQPAAKSTAKPSKASSTKPKK